jgi:transcriptional regulator with XRE-family HTH domain
MQTFDEIGENYTSPHIDELLAAVPPEESARIGFKMALSARIQTAMKEKGIKSIQLAEALKLKSPSIVSKWLSGGHNFTVDTLVDIQRVLGVNLLRNEPEEIASAENFTVFSWPAGTLHESIHAPLAGVINHAGGLQPTSVIVNRGA